MALGARAAKHGQAVLVFCGFSRQPRVACRAVQQNATRGSGDVLQQAGAHVRTGRHIVPSVVVADPSATGTRVPVSRPPLSRSFFHRSVLPPPCAPCLDGGAAECHSARRRPRRRHGPAPPSRHPPHRTRTCASATPYRALSVYARTCARVCLCTTVGRVSVCVCVVSWVCVHVSRASARSPL